MYTCLTMTLTCLTMTLTACPVGATWVGVLRTPTQVAWEQLFGLRPSPCGGPSAPGGASPPSGASPHPLCIYICVYVPPQASFFPKVACPPYGHPMSVNIQALQTRVAVWPEGPLRSNHINSVGICRINRFNKGL